MVIGLEPATAKLAKTLFQKAAAAVIADRRKAAVGKKELGELLKPWFRPGPPEQRFLKDAASELASFSHEFPGLDDNERVATLLAVSDAFERENLTDRVLFDVHVDATKLARRLRIEQAEAKTNACLSEAGDRFYDAALDRCCVLYVRAVVQVETFVGRAVTEIMKQVSNVPDQVADRLSDFPDQVVAGVVNALREDRAAVADQPDSEHVAAQLSLSGGVPVSEADPRRLGVHAAISVAGVPDEVPPEYVLRDTDAAESGIRAKVAAAAERGGFVLLVGGSSVGKTRCAVEAVRALLPDWWLVHPAGPAEVTALATAPSPRMVVWLDELQRYLDGEHGLTGAVVRALLNPPHAAVIIGTLWPDRYNAYTTLPISGGADPHTREREVLELAAVIRIAPEFSPAEQDRARIAAQRDLRLQAALDTAGYGLTQTLAAAPQLVARWQDAQTASPYAWAVLTAALDAVRLGARAPLSDDLLRAAAPGYCTSQQQAEAPGDWFERALDYATAKLHGAAAALVPAGAGMGQVAGYTVADYLIQHASRERRTVRAPASTWDAILGHIGDPADAARLADSAEDRLLHRYAIPLYRHAANAGDGRSAVKLAGLLAGRGDLDGAVQVLRPRADAGDEAAEWQLAGLLAERGDLDGLRARADAGDGTAAYRLADLLGQGNDLDGLRARADAGDGYAACELAELLAGGGDLDGATQVLRAAADAGDEAAAGRRMQLLADLLDHGGDLDGAAQVLRAGVDAGDKDAAWQLADLLAGRGDLDGAAQMLRTRADAGDKDTAWRLALLLTKRGDLAGAAQVFRALADAGHEVAAERLAELLAKRGDLDGLRARADAGDGHAAKWLPWLLERRGDLDGAEQILRARADAGDEAAAGQMIPLLERRGDLDGLRARADAGDGRAAVRLAELLAGRGDLDGAEQILRPRADAGDEYAARRLVELLANHRDLDGLRARADADDGYAARRLAGLLAEVMIKEGRSGEAERLRRFGLNLDGSIASG